MLRLMREKKNYVPKCVMREKGKGLLETLKFLISFEFKKEKSFCSVSF